MEVKFSGKKTEHEAEKEAKITHNISDAENKRFWMLKKKKDIVKGNERMIWAKDKTTREKGSSFWD